MKEIFRNADSALVGLYQSMLEDAEIPTFVYNLGTQQTLVAGLVTSLFPLPLFFPTLCVLHDEDYEEAMRLLAPLRAGDAAPAEVLPEWACGRCGEAVPGHFMACWQCSQPRG